MRSIKRRLALWHIVLIIGMAAITIPVAARSYIPAKAIFNEWDECLGQHIGNHHKDADAKDSKDEKDPKASKEDRTVGSGVGRRQDDYYERRRQHWEKRLDNRLDDEEIGDDNDDEFDDEDVYERRREYYRDRLDEDW